MPRARAKHHIRGAGAGPLTSAGAVISDAGTEAAAISIKQPYSALQAASKKQQEGAFDNGAFPGHINGDPLPPTVHVQPWLPSPEKWSSRLPVTLVALDFISSEERGEGTSSRSAQIPDCSAGGWSITALPASCGSVPGQDMVLGASWVHWWSMEGLWETPGFIHGSS